MGLVKDGKKNQDEAEQSWFSPATWGLASPDDDDPATDGVEIEPRDHREFPFSERDEYPKFSVQEALAPSTKAPVKGKWSLRLSCWMWKLHLDSSYLTHRFCLMVCPV